MLYNELSDLLFHGYNAKVSDVDLSKGVLNSADIGYVSVFEFSKNVDFKIKRFGVADLDWLNFVLFNRGFVKENILNDDYDIVIGPVANDAVGLVLHWQSAFQTDDLIAGAINSISGFIIAKYAEQYDIPLDSAMENFYKKELYLANKHIKILD